MIIGHISDSVQNEFISKHPKLKEALAAIQAHTFDENNGEKQFYSEDCFGFVNTLNTREFDGRYEAHHKYLDLFYCIEGNEEVYVTPVDEEKIVEPYIEEKDIYFLEAVADTKITLHEGDYVILFPEDGHAPGIGDGSLLKKLVLKIKI